METNIIIIFHSSLQRYSISITAIIVTIKEDFFLNTLQVFFMFFYLFFFTLFKLRELSRYVEESYEFPRNLPLSKHRIILNIWANQLAWNYVYCVTLLARRFYWLFFGTKCVRIPNSKAPNHWLMLFFVLEISNVISIFALIKLRQRFIYICLQLFWLQILVTKFVE